MILKLLIGLFLLLGVLCLVDAIQSQDKWEVADSATERLSPTSFRQLPENIAQHLQERGCTVPQSFVGSGPHNVISGQFAKNGQTDWAVLCSKDKVSSILVFWRGSTKSVSEIAKAPDKDFLQVIDVGEKIGFSRVIEAVVGDYITDHYNAYGGPKPPPIDHQGINDAFVEKASVVRYYYRGKWLELQGAD